MREIRKVLPLSFIMLLSWYLSAFRAGAGGESISPRSSESNLFPARRGELTVWVSEPDHQPAPGVTVRVEQISHEFLFGTAIRADIFFAASVGPAYQETLRSNFNAIATGPLLRWPRVQPTEKTHRWRDTESILAWCAQEKLPVLGEQIVTGGDFPEWTATFSPEELRKAANGFFEWLGLNSRLQVSFYEFISYPLDCPLLISEETDFARKTADSLLSANPSALLYIGDRDLLADPERCAQMVTLVQTLVSQGIVLNGLCAHARSLGSIDSERVAGCLNMLGEAGLPVFVTGASLRGKNAADAVADLVLLLSTVFAHPAASGFFFEDILPSESESDRVSLYNTDMTPTECGLAYQHVYHQEWRTRTEGRTDHVGRFTCSAFLGEYLVSAVSPDGRRAETRATLSKQTGREIVALHLPPKTAPPTSEPSGDVPATATSPDAEAPVRLF